MQMNKNITEFSPEAMDVLKRFRWPGNVRELANAIERAMVLGKPPAIGAGDLPIALDPLSEKMSGDSLAEIEKAHIQAVLERTGWNISRAAEILKIDRVTLYNKNRKYGLQK